jgi:hypothetical protein
MKEATSGQALKKGQLNCEQNLNKSRNVLCYVAPIQWTPSEAMSSMYNGGDAWEEKVCKQGTAIHWLLQ